MDTRLYDAQNRLESITRGADVADGIAALHVTFGYDNAGRQSRVNRYHGSDDSAGVSWNTVLDYDEAGRLTTIIHSDPLDSVNPLSVYERVFSQAGAIESTTVTLGTTEHLTKTYSQDNRGQVISEAYFSGSSPSSQHTTRSYGPDAAGNRALEVIQSQTHHHTIDRDNRLVSDSRWSYTHDDEGNVTSKTSADGKSLWQYAWDHRNRLTEATLRYDASGNVSATSSITRTVSQTYDGLDRWIGSENSETSEKHLYVHDSGQLTLEFVDGAVENRYLWADGVDQLLAEDGAAANEEPRWTLTDHLGSVRDIVSETTSLSHTDYDAFGNVEGTAADLLFGYTARPYDESTGLQNNHHRWYDSESGRFVGQDPIGFDAGDPNLYRYVGNQPMTKVDPDGLNEKYPGIPIEGKGGTWIDGMPGNGTWKPYGMRGVEVPYRNGWPLQGNDQLVFQTLVRPLGVVMDQVLAGGVVEHSFAEEDHSASQFRLVAEHEPFNVGIHVRRATRQDVRLDAARFQRLLEEGGVLGIAIHQEDRGMIFPLENSIALEGSVGRGGHPGFIGVCRAAEELNLAGGQTHCEQQVDGFQSLGRPNVDGCEVDRCQTLPVGLQEFGPGSSVAVAFVRLVCRRSCTFVRPVETILFKNVFYGGIGQVVTKFF